MYNSLSALKEALRKGDAEAVLQEGFDLNILVPNEELTEDMIPLTPDWSWPSLAQGFALLFNGYEWAEEKGISLFVLLEQAEKNNGESLDKYSLTELRSILFALQRSRRDSRSGASPVFVTALLGAIKHKVKFGLFE